MSGIAEIFSLKFNLNNNIIFRRCRYEDLGGVIYVNRKVLPENYSLQLFLTMFRLYNDIFYVAIDKSKQRVIGYCMNKIEYNTNSFFSSRKVTKGHIFSLGVLPEYRRRGIATALMVLTLKSMLENRQCDEVFLEVRVSNIPAQNLYRKLGFKIVARARSYYADGEDAYIMAAQREDIAPLVNRLYERIRKYSEDSESTY